MIFRQEIEFSTINMLHDIDLQQYRGAYYVS